MANQVVNQSPFWRVWKMFLSINDQHHLAWCKIIRTRLIQVLLFPWLFRRHLHIQLCRWKFITLPDNSFEIYLIVNFLPVHLLFDGMVRQARIFQQQAASISIMSPLGNSRGLARCSCFDRQLCLRVVDQRIRIDNNCEQYQLDSKKSSILHDVWLLMKYWFSLPDYHAQLKNYSRFQKYCFATHS